MNKSIMTLGATLRAYNKDVNGDMALKDLLNRYVVKDLKDMAKVINAPVKASAKKDDLIEAISQSIPQVILGEGDLIGDNEKKYLRAYIKRISARTREMEQGAIVLRVCGIVHTGYKDQNLIEMIPADLIPYVRQVMEDEQAEINPVLVKRLDAMAVYYGAMTLNEVIDELNKANIIKGKPSDVLEEVVHALEHARLAVRNGHMLTHGKIQNPEVLYQAICQGAYKSYAPVKAAIEDQIALKKLPSFSIHHDKLKAYLVDDLGLDPIVAAIEIENVQIKMNLDWNFERIIASMSDKINLTSVNQKDKLGQLMGLVFQHTPRWIDRGRTPHEVYIPKEDTKPEIPDQTAQPVVGGQKVGRNDSCPCGSGKKYKKCCGA